MATLNLIYFTGDSCHMASSPMSRRAATNTENENENNFSDAAPAPRKRIRDNHNELERARRVHQKAQLDALRAALPFQDMDEKASMVSIFIRAREYIFMLEQRIVELQGSAGAAAPNAVGSNSNILSVPVNPAYHNYQEHHQSSSSPLSQNILLPAPQKLPSLQYSLLARNQTNMPEMPFGRDRQLSINPEHVHVHQGIPFYNAGFLSNPSPANVEVSNIVTPASSPVSTKHRQSSVNADILRSFISDTYLRQRGSANRSSSDEEGTTNFKKSFPQRRGSSLLMPFEEETIMFQKRDSLSALFSGLLPDFIDSSVLSSGNVNCHKCKKGMCNMIMIDCDRCHKWYHIKCANIESDSIPTNWTCC